MYSSDVFQFLDRIWRLVKNPLERLFVRLCLSFSLCSKVNLTGRNFNYFIKKISTKPSKRWSFVVGRNNGLVLLGP